MTAKSLRIAIGSDHGGYDIKTALIKFLKDESYIVQDFGTNSREPCDYPIIGFEVAKAVSECRAARGILICKTAIGMTIIANKLRGVRAGSCYDVKMAISSVEHNDCNVLSLAANYTDLEKSIGIVKAWLGAKHLGERHARRVKQIKDLEKKV